MYNGKPELKPVKMQISMRLFINALKKCGFVLIGSIFIASTITEKPAFMPQY
jgi:hypothetical protein